MSPARLMIKIWEFSHHFLHSTADDSFDCQCENYIYFDTTLYHFQFHRKKYVCLMSLKNEDYKEQLMERIVRGGR